VSSRPAAIVARRLPARLVASALLAAWLLIPAAALGMGAPAAPRAKTNLLVIERQVMCVTCKIPLNVAESPQADREKAFIRTLIDEGQDEAQIKQALVGQYGAAVLGLPAAKGFDLAVYLVPLAAVILLAATLLTLLPRWRRATREQAAAENRGSPLGAADAARLESDLARFD
jgi:cytochrome c-type biogenesis protein CcmH/NrfF